MQAPLIGILALWLVIVGPSQIDKNLLVILKREQDFIFVFAALLFPVVITLLGSPWLWFFRSFMLVINLWILVFDACPERHEYRISHVMFVICVALLNVTDIIVDEALQVANVSGGSDCDGCTWYESLLAYTLNVAEGKKLELYIRHLVAT